MDLKLSKVRIAEIPTTDPEKLRTQREQKFEKDKKRHIGRIRNQKELNPTIIDRVPEASDFYNNFDRYQISPREKRILSSLGNEASKWPAGYLHEIKINNNGGIISPIVIEFTFKNG